MADLHVCVCVYVRSEVPKQDYPQHPLGFDFTDTPLLKPLNRYTVVCTSIRPIFCSLTEVSVRVKER